MSRSRLKNKQPLESAIQRVILKILELNGWVVVKVNNVGILKPNGKRIPPREKGVSDIIACAPNGQFVAIEVKRPGNKPTAHQEAFMNRVKAAGGAAFVMDDPNQATELCDQFRKRYG